MNIHNQKKESISEGKRNEKRRKQGSRNNQTDMRRNKRETEQESR